jgi:hypothetical protein
MTTKPTAKPTAKHACAVCKHEFRADNLMRHVYNHRNELTTFMKPARVKFCIDNKMPVMYPDTDEWIMCLICRKTARLGGHGTSVKDFIRNYNTIHSKCKECYDSVKELYDPPKNTLIDLVTTVGDTAPPPTDSKYVVRPELCDQIKSIMEFEEDEEMDINEMIECLLVRLNIRQKRINALEKQLNPDATN